MTKFEELVKKESETTTQGTGRFQQFVEKNRKLINISSVGIIVIVVLVFVIRYFVSKSEEEMENKASVAISRILPYLDVADYQHALYGDKTKKVRGENIIGLIEIVKNYKGIPQGKIAALYAGNCLLQLNKYTEALEYFKIALDSKSSIALEGASAGLAVTYENLKNYSEAAKYHELASTYALPTGVKNRYMYFAALCYEKIGEKSKAEKLFRQIIGDNKSEFVGLSKAGLVRLGIIIE